jgi:folate-binding protein YgfZ
MAETIDGAILAEYRAAHEKAAWFDQSTRGKIELTGKDALLFLHNLCTNDVKNLPAGSGCEAFLCTAKAKVVAYIAVSHVLAGDRDIVLLDCEPGQAERVISHLNHFLISEQVELADRTAELDLVHVCGPKAQDVLGKLVGKPVSDLQEWQHRTQTLADVGICHCRRHDPFDLPGFDVLCPHESGPALRQTLTSAGTIPGGEQTREILRVEAGTPVYGKDIDLDRAVMEVGRTRQAISYTKGCFLGQEPIVMARDRGHVNRTLLGIRMSEGGPAAPGTILFKDNNEVGQVTSSVLSPHFGVIGLAYVKRGFQEPGTSLLLDPSRDGRTAVITAMPFRGS